eukprot:1492690-Rhodomonas_salina.1
MDAAHDCFGGEEEEEEAEPVPAFTTDVWGGVEAEAGARADEAVGLGSSKAMLRISEEGCTPWRGSSLPFRAGSRSVATLQQGVAAGCTFQLRTPCSCRVR